MCLIKFLPSLSIGTASNFLSNAWLTLIVQRLKPHKIILIDNVNFDGPVEIAWRFFVVRLVLLDQNIEFALGKNLAIERTSVVPE